MKDPLLLEIQEELNRDRLMNVLKRFAPLIGIAALLVIVLFGGYEAWNFYKTAEAKKQGNIIFTALETNDATALSSAKLSGDFDSVAKLSAAAIKAGKGEIDEAVKIYNTLAANKSADIAIRDLAVLNKSALLMNLLSEDKLVRKELTEISAAGRPFHYSALELLGALELKNGNEDAAKKIFTKLAQDKNTPFGIASRAKQMAN